LSEARKYKLNLIMMRARLLKMVLIR